MTPHIHIKTQCYQANSLISHLCEFAHILEVAKISNIFRTRELSSNNSQRNLPVPPHSSMVYRGVQLGRRPAVLGTVLSWAYATLASLWSWILDGPSHWQHLASSSAVPESHSMLIRQCRSVRSRTYSKADKSVQNTHRPGFEEESERLVAQENYNWAGCLSLTLPSHYSECIKTFKSNQQVSYRIRNIKFIAF